MKSRNRIVSLLMVSGLAACGAQDPAFLETQQGVMDSRSAQGVGGSGDASAEEPFYGDSTVASSEGGAESGSASSGGGSAGGSQGQVNIPGASGPVSIPGVSGPVSIPGGGSVPSQPQSPGGSVPPAPVVFHNDPSNPSSPTFTVPGISESESAQLASCITKWGRVPFTGTFTNVRRIKAAVTVYGTGVSINDTLQTSSPALILVDAGVNVLGSATYNFLNDNGYYCMKVNVNVKASLNVNLACHARLADNSVQVNVGSTTNSTTSVVGVNVGSNVQVQTMTPAQQACVN